MSTKGTVVMDDLTLNRLLGTLEIAAPHRPDFDAVLHERLVTALGYRNRRRGWWGGPSAPDSTGWMQPPSSLRLVYLAAVLGLLLALVVGLVLVGSPALVRDPNELIRLSKAAWNHPPAFSEAITWSGGGSQRLESNGHGVWRIDYPDPNGAPTGQYQLVDGATVGTYDPSSQVWSTDRWPFGSAPPILGEFTWLRRVADGSAQGRLVDFGCGDPELLSPGDVAGRRADRLRCSDTGMEYWLDRETHLTLKITAGSATPDWDPGAWMAASDFSVGVAGAGPDTFSMSGPAGAFGLGGEPASHSLAVGDPLPELSGRLLDGATFSSSSLSGRPAAILVWGTGVVGPYLRTFATEVGRRTDRLAAVVLSFEDQVVASAAAADVGFTGQMVLDTGTGQLTGPLGLNWWPTLILVDAGGRIRSLSHQVDDPAGLAPMLEALIANASIPGPAWSPGPGQDVVSTKLAVGVTAPSWAVPLPDGVTVGTDDLAGKLAAVYFGWIGMGGDGAAAEAAAYQALASFSDVDPAGRAVILIDANPYAVAQATSALRSYGVDLPLAGDRDGTVGRAWGLTFDSSLVLLDRTGRVAWFGAGSCLDVNGLLLQLAGGIPMPTPSNQLVAGCP
jgi:peroxiredoxin